MSKNNTTKKVFSIRVSEELIKAVDEIAEKTGFTRNSLINFILFNAVKANNFEKIKKIKEL